MSVLSLSLRSLDKFVLGALFCFLFLSLFAPTADAATLSLRPASGTYELGEEFSATVELDPEGVPLFGVDATMTFDPALLFVLDVSGEASVIDDWESEPSFSNDEGTISFSGTSDKAIRVNSMLLSIDFRVVGHGESNLSFSEVILTTEDNEPLADAINSPNISYTTVLPSRPHVYTTVTTVSSADLWPTLFSDAVMLNLGLLIVLLVFLGHLAYVHKQFKLREQRLKSETAEIHEQLTKIFSALRDEIYDQIRSITKRAKLSKNEAGAVAGLNQALEVSETLISKEINDVKNLLD